MGKLVAALLLASVSFNGYLIWRQWGREPEPGLQTSASACVSADTAPRKLSYRFFPGSSLSTVPPSGRAVAPEMPEKDQKLTLDHPLCQVALESLAKQSDENVKGFLEFFGALREPRALEASFEDNLRQVVVSVGAEKTKATSLRKDFGDLYFRNAKEFLGHTTTNPPNFRSMLEISKRQWTEEDALIQKSFGDDQLKEYRSVQAKRRMELLAVLSRYSKIPWDDALKGVMF